MSKFIKDHLYLSVSGDWGIFKFVSEKNGNLNFTIIWLGDPSMRKDFIGKTLPWSEDFKAEMLDDIPAESKEKLVKLVLGT